MATIKTTYENTLVTGFRQLDDGTYKVYFLAPVENPEGKCGGFRKYNAICKEDVYFGNIISSENCYIPLTIVIKELKTGWVIEDIVRDGYSIFHKDDWATKFFVNLNKVKGGKANA